MILVFGKNGQVATALQQHFPNALFLGHDKANFLDSAAIEKILDHHQPRIVINAAAYTQVDKAESEKKEALQINAKTPEVIAQWCKRSKALLIHYSTDYVFNGSGDRPWVETDIPDPVNYYGHSKWEGEKAIQKSGCPHYIFRVSWVYSPWGQNFKKTILRLALEREELQIVNDQWGAPTKAEDIAKETARIVEKYQSGNPPEYGIYHWRFADYTTWHQFALDIVQEAKQMGLPIKVKNIKGIPTEAYPTPAKRPKNSRLGTVRTE